MEEEQQAGEEPGAAGEVVRGVEQLGAEGISFVSLDHVLAVAFQLTDLPSDIIQQCQMYLWEMEEAEDVLHAELEVQVGQ